MHVAFYPINNGIRLSSGTCNEGVGTGFINSGLRIDNLQGGGPSCLKAIPTKRKHKVYKGREDCIELVVGKDVKLEDVLSLDMKTLIGFFSGMKVAMLSLGD